MSVRKALDWEQARAGLARIANGGKAGTASREEKERVFRMRAELLAKPVVSIEAKSDGESIMMFRIGSARYGVPLSDVAEVLANSVCAKVPGAPAEVAGVIQVRGEIRPVYELSRILGLAEGAGQSTPAVLLLRRNGREFGVRISSVEDIRAVGLQERLAAPAGARHARWITKDLAIVLDTESLWGGEDR